MRALAVIAVLAFHSGLPGFPGGYVGVDVFFVISGYLITGLLLRELDRNHTISLTRFYARRIRRLLPAATLLFLISTKLPTLTSSASSAPGRNRENGPISQSLPAVAPSM